MLVQKQKSSKELFVRSSWKLYLCFQLNKLDSNFCILKSISVTVVLKRLK